MGHKQQYLIMNEIHYKNNGTMEKTFASKTSREHLEFKNNLQFIPFVRCSVSKTSSAKVNVFMGEHTY